MLYRLGIAALGTIFVGLGLTMILVTALRGGGVGLLLGALFVALGAARLYLLARR